MLRWFALRGGFFIHLEPCLGRVGKIAELQQMPGEKMGRADSDGWTTVSPE